jgi:hypothetical protein
MGAREHFACILSGTLSALRVGCGLPDCGAGPRRLGDGMPIPAAPADDRVSNAIVALLRQLHDQVRDEIAGLDEAELNWSPMTGANTIATILTHLIGSEAETVRVTAGLPAERDWGSEFKGHRRPAQPLSRDDHGESLPKTPPRIGTSARQGRCGWPGCQDGKRGWSWWPSRMSGASSMRSMTR